MSESRLKLVKILRFARNVHLRRVVRPGGRYKTLGEGGVGANLICRSALSSLFLQNMGGAAVGGRGIFAPPPLHTVC